MQFEITSINSAYYINQEDVDVSQFVKDNDVIGRVFDSEEAMDAFIYQLEDDHEMKIESFTIVEHMTEEEHEEEWNSLIASAWDESEDSGRSFDHIMGEHLAGIY